MRNVYSVRSGSVIHWGLDGTAGRSGSRGGIDGCEVCCWAGLQTQHRPLQCTPKCIKITHFAVEKGRNLSVISATQATVYYTENPLYSLQSKL